MYTIPPLASSIRDDNRPTFILPITYSDLTDRRPTQEEIDEIVVRLNRHATLFMLSMINSLLSFREKESEVANDLQGFLFSNLIDDDLFERAKRRFGKDRMEQRPVFHRQQLLTLMRRVLLVASDEGDLDPSPNDAREARHALGRVALMTSDLISAEDQAQKLETAPDIRSAHDELFAQLLPSFELSNPPDAERSLIRMDDYFRIFEQGGTSFVFADGQSLTDQFSSLTGLNLRRYLMLVYCVFAYYQIEAKHPERLIAETQRFNIDTKTYFANTDATPEEVVALFRLIAMSTDDLIAAVRGVAHESPLRPYHGFIEFRRRPLVYSNESRGIVTVVDMGFLIEKLAVNVYHTILSSLEGDDAAQRSDRKNFLRYWGEVFEIYVNDRLGEVFPAEGKRLYRSPKYDRPKARRNEEAFDAVIDYGEALIVMEHKGKYLEMKAKYAEDRDLLITDLDVRFGRAARQLADNIETVFNPNEARQGEFSERDDNGEPTLRFTVEDSARVRRIYPVVFVQDSSLRIGFANRWLRERFEDEIKRRSVDHDMIRPLSLINVEDMERIIPYLDVLSLADILDEYTKEHESLVSFMSVFDALRRQRRIPHRTDERFQTRYHEMHKDLKSMFVVPG